MRSKKGGNSSDNRLVLNSEQVKQVERNTPLKLQEKRRVPSAYTHGLHYRDPHPKPGARDNTQLDNCRTRAGAIRYWAPSGKPHGEMPKPMSVRCARDRLGVVNG